MSYPGDKWMLALGPLVLRGDEAGGFSDAQMLSDPLFMSAIQTTPGTLRQVRAGIKFPEEGGATFWYRYLKFMTALSN